MIEILLWWTGGAFIGAMLVCAIILHEPSQCKILDPEAIKDPNYISHIAGIRAIPALHYCTPYGKKLVGLFWFLAFSALLSFGVYLGEK